MRLLNFARFISWKLLGIIERDSTYRRYVKIKSIMEDDDIYNKYIDEQLDEILNYASKNTAFYRAFSGKSLKEFPVIQKNYIMDNQGAFLSKEFIGKKTHVMGSSGSTGIPFKIEQDFEKRKQVHAELIYYNGLLGYTPGSKFVFLRNLEPAYMKPRWKQFLLNEELIATQKYSGDDIKKIVDRLKISEPNSIMLGYSSSLFIVAKYMKENSIQLKNFDGVISGAEGLPHNTRKLVEQQFQCPVVSRYSNMENGILAQDSEENLFLLNRASYYFEILKLDSDEEADFGEIGRIIVTDLYNKATPMIRYDTGDLGSFEMVNGRIYLTKVYGRKVDMLYTTEDTPVIYFALDEYFQENYDIEQYQIVQESNKLIKLRFFMKEGKTLDEDWCIRKTQSVLGADCKVEISYFNEIPITNSGKFRYVICNYKPDEEKDIK